MSGNEIVLWITTAVAVATALGAVIRDRRKPELDTAQAQSALVNSDAVKAEIRRMSDQSNMQRDLRILDLERWGDEMRPWASSVVHEFHTMCELMREDRKLLGLDMPELTIAPMPKFPEPRQMPQ